MELVYLWVKKYKNIEEQGFNFSSKFYCEYNEEEKKLTINKNDDYIPDFFGENINVTAIVGKNGSGKSSLLKLENNIPNNIEIIYDNDVLYIISSKAKFNTMTIINKTTCVIKNRGTNAYNKSKLYFNWDIIKPVYGDIYRSMNKIKDTNILKPLLQKEDSHLLDLHYFNIEIMKKIIQFNHEFSFQTFFYKPYYIELHIITENKEELEVYNVGKKILQLEIVRKQKMKFDEFFDSYYKDNKEDVNQLLSKELLLFKITDIEGRDFFDLSHGERSIFLTNLILFDKVKEKNTDLIIYLDEPDLTLHPEWQKRYMNELVKTFSSWDKKIHFIITSHSPFIVSDIPKENIIFLKDGKQVNGLKEKKQTFGANIHTLLSDSFFMEDGLIGEFAKSKIDDVINYFHGKESKIKDNDEAQKLIHIIGEPIVKNQLQRMLDSKRLKKIDKIDAIEKDIKALQEALAKLKK